MAARVGIRELRARLASHLESVTPIEVTRHGRTIGLYVPFPQQAELDERQRLLEAGRLMQAGPRPFAWCKSGGPTALIRG